MDFDYQKVKDEESRQRDERISSLAVLQPRPMPRPTPDSEAPSNIQKPPIKPRHSLKCRPNPQPGSAQSRSQVENEERKRIAPAQVLNPTGPLDAQTPSLQAHNLLWFQRTQLPRLPKPIPCWLHGFATRREAEQLLQDKQQGCFLLRLSESKVGFVLSYRGADKCRHFIIEEECNASRTESQYSIAGEISRHNSLEGLINYYTLNPVGPFNETLTVPCMQSNGSCENKAKLGVNNKAECGEERVTTPPPSREYPPTRHDVQYAVVKKALRKSHSVSECLIAQSDMQPLVHENTDSEATTEAAHTNDTAETVTNDTDMGIVGDVSYPVDAPYARVNKPQRPAQPSTINEPDSAVGGAAAAAETQSVMNAAAVAEQKYWELEPMHTYEEALHTRPREDQLSFYAVGRHRENGRDADQPANHVYSEVNIKGIRDEPLPASPSPRTSAFISTRPVPRLPLRFGPRSAHVPVRPESGNQNFASSATRNPPFHHRTLQVTERSEFSIYEQIPERTPKSRPPLPPPNSKR